MNDKDHDFGDGTVCKNCGVERLHNTKKRFYMRDGRLVNEDKCGQHAAGKYTDEEMQEPCAGA